PAAGYRDIQLALRGTKVVSAADFDRLPDRPVTARFTGIWRDDLAIEGSYLGPGGTDSSRNHCKVEKRHFCRVPVVPEDWKPGQPVLGLASRCPPSKTPEKRTLLVTLIPASHDDSGLMDFEDR